MPLGHRIGFPSRTGLLAELREIRNLAKKAGVDLEKSERMVVKLLTGEKRLTATQIKRDPAVNIQSEFFPYVMRILELKGLLVRTHHRHITDHLIRYGLMEEWIHHLQVPDGR